MNYFGYHKFLLKIKPTQLGYSNIAFFIAEFKQYKNNGKSLSIVYKFMLILPLSFSDLTPNRHSSTFSKEEGKRKMRFCERNKLPHNYVNES